MSNNKDRKNIKSFKLGLLLIIAWTIVVVYLIMLESKGPLAVNKFVSSDIPKFEKVFTKFLLLSWSIFILSIVFLRQKINEFIETQDLSKTFYAIVHLFVTFPSLLALLTVQDHSTLASVSSIISLIVIIASTFAKK